MFPFVQSARKKIEKLGKRTARLADMKDGLTGKPPPPPQTTPSSTCYKTSAPSPATIKARSTIRRLTRSNRAHHTTKKFNNKGEKVCPGELPLVL
jgi:hypothetical protein